MRPAGSTPAFGREEAASRRVFHAQAEAWAYPRSNCNRNCNRNRNRKNSNSNRNRNRKNSNCNHNHNRKNNNCDRNCKSNCNFERGVC